MFSLLMVLGAATASAVGEEFTCWGAAFHTKFPHGACSQGTSASACVLGANGPCSGAGYPYHCDGHDVWISDADANLCTEHEPAGAFVCGGHGGPPTPGKIAIAAVGDSITDGAHSSGGNTTYPGQLQILLDSDKATADKYCVVNLGESGATMQKSPRGDSPYWKRGSFPKLTGGKWDIVVLMLGTNDAKDACGVPASFCKPNITTSCCNWPHPGQTNWTQDCSDGSCPFATDYAAMIEVIRGVGKAPGTPPDIYLAIPPPLMAGGSPAVTSKPYGMNQTVINDIFPVLLPKINAANKMPHPIIDVFSALGGTPGLECGYAPKESTPELCSHSCVASPHDPKCWPQCDTQSCDPCHPNDQGYTAMAKTVLAALKL